MDVDHAPKALQLLIDLQANKWIQECCTQADRAWLYKLEQHAAHVVHVENAGKQT